jgi:hypothetical protein
MPVHASVEISQGQAINFSARDGAKRWLDDGWHHARIGCEYGEGC